MIETVSETGSTNADLSARIRAGKGVIEGDWLIADRQSAGKGRQGREWSDGMGNFMGSTVVQLSGNEPHAPSLALVAGLAVYEAIIPRLTSPGQLFLKWPNDVLLSGAKLAGILLEREGDNVVVGIGVNLAKSPRLARARTVSLDQFGPAPDRDSFAADLVSAFAREVGNWRAYGLEPMIARWLAAAHPLGAQLSVHQPDGTMVSGTFAGLAGDCAMRLRLADGSTRAIHAGDVSLEGN